MAIQKTIDDLKEKSKDEKKAIAGGIAFMLVVVLFLGWAFFFFKKIQRGQETPQLGGGVQDEFVPSAVRDAQNALLKDTSNIDELRALRDQGSQEYQQGALQEGFQESGGNAFGGSGSPE